MSEPKTRVKAWTDLRPPGLDCSPSSLKAVVDVEGKALLYSAGSLVVQLPPDVAAKLGQWLMATYVFTGDLE